jgi:hypothetical protein
LVGRRQRSGILNIVLTTFGPLSLVFAANKKISAQTRREALFPYFHPACQIRNVVHLCSEAIASIHLLYAYYYLCAFSMRCSTATGGILSTTATSLLRCITTSGLRLPTTTGSLPLPTTRSSLLLPVATRKSTVARFLPFLGGNADYSFMKPQHH